MFTAKVASSSDEVRLAVLAEQELLAEPAGVGVLVDEALALAVHEDAATERRGGG